MAGETLVSVESTLPASIGRVVEFGVRAVEPMRVFLYGSRARGDARENSDYDLAFVFSPAQHGKWVRFLADLDDAPVTLLPVDLLDWNEASEPLREEIRKEGITLYERNSGD
ncbi:MAG: nucleotidyltransferase domain-containing protein [Phycisphaerae bacterium]|nr:nucleotidyltransferase domain-containing protein [Phycisphaerae bacterium]